ncbi:MAG: carboxypeptidase regulatory-like domain-containing protein [Rhodospirillaceae bacterium]
MKRTLVSPQRRQLMIAGLAAAATPTALFAASAAYAAPVDGEPLVMSGRVVARDGSPVRGATLIAAHDTGARATTDADGRFFIKTTTPNGGKFAYRVTRPGDRSREERLNLVYSEASRGARALPLRRDEGGVWRGALALTLA